MVQLALADGQVLMATLENGWFSAWWPAIIPDEREVPAPFPRIIIRGFDRTGTLVDAATSEELSGPENLPQGLGTMLATAVATLDEGDQDLRIATDWLRWRLVIRDREVVCASALRTVFVVAHLIRSRQPRVLLPQW